MTGNRKSSEEKKSSWPVNDSTSAGDGFCLQEINGVSKGRSSTIYGSYIFPNVIDQTNPLMKIQV